MLKGSCLCGGIRYEIDADLGPVTNCHCSQCRKASGAAFASNASVPAAAFRFIAALSCSKSGNLLPEDGDVFAGDAVHRS